MADHPNYRALSPPADKAPDEYTYVERRAELYDLIEQAGHYRNLERSTRDLGARFGVSHTTIQKDIRRILEWKADNLGQHIDAELETLKTKAVREALDNGEAAKAYSIMSQHLRNLQSLGIKGETPDQLEVSGPDGGPLNVTVAHDTRVDSDGDD
jgi:hypothetical protein